jgi:DNA-binding NarL/FixJ family response regulator
VSLQVCVTDDHLLVRAGLKVMLGNHDIHVALEAASGDELLRQIEALGTCDVVMLDIRMPGRDGFQTLSALKSHFPRLPVVFFTGHENPHYYSQAMALGAAGLIPKSATAEKIAQVVKLAATGEKSFTREDARRVSGALATPRLGIEHEVPLTNRECEVLRHMSGGLTNQVIAQQMGISYETVKEHVQHILQKIGVVDRTQAVYWGLRTGVIPLDP